MRPPYDRNMYFYIVPIIKLLKMVTLCPTPSYYSVQFYVYRLLIAPSIIDNLILLLLATQFKRLTLVGPKTLRNNFINARNATGSARVKKNDKIIILLTKTTARKYNPRTL